MIDKTKKYQTRDGRPATLLTKWMPIETAPRNCDIIGMTAEGHIAKCRIGRYYVKWPHEEGGPTYKEEWNEVQPDAIFPWSPAYWIPNPPLGELNDKPLEQP